MYSSTLLLAPLLLTLTTASSSSTTSTPPATSLADHILSDLYAYDSSQVTLPAYSSAWSALTSALPGSQITKDVNNWANPDSTATKAAAAGGVPAFVTAEAVPTSVRPELSSYFLGADSVISKDLAGMTGMVTTTTTSGAESSGSASSTANPGQLPYNFTYPNGTSNSTMSGTGTAPAGTGISTITSTSTSTTPPPTSSSSSSSSTASSSISNGGAEASQPTGVLKVAGAAALGVLGIAALL